MRYAPSVRQDQLEVLLAVVDAGGFGAAARMLGRTQGGVSYHIGRLEEQLELVLFDRSAHRPALTEAGAAVVREARNVATGVQRLKAVARGLSEGLEPRLRIAVDVVFPGGRLADALGRLNRAFPTVDLSVQVGVLDEPARAVRSGEATLGISYAPEVADLVAVACGEVRFLPVAAPSFPLATQVEPITEEHLRRHPNLVVPADVPGPDAALRGRRWHVSDFSMRQSLVRRGLGWSRLPAHQVADDLAAGRLVVLDMAKVPGAGISVPLALFHHPDRPPGPAGRRLRDWLEHEGPEAI